MEIHTWGKHRFEVTNEEIRIRKPKDSQQWLEERDKRTNNEL